MELFITRPEHDDATYYLSCYAKELIELAESKGITVFDLNKERATAKETSKFLDKKNPTLAMFNGHGDKNTIRGHKNEVLIKSGENEKLLENKIVYCRSCNSAAELGKNSIRTGTTAFIGYDDLFGFPFNPQKAANPQQDEFAKPCLETSNQVTKSLLKGNTAGEAYDNSQTTADKWIEKMQNTNAPPEAPHIALWLTWNKLHQKIHGNKQAKP